MNLTSLATNSINASSTLEISNGPAPIGNGLAGSEAPDQYGSMTTDSKAFTVPFQIQILMCLLYGTLTLTAVASNMIVSYIVLSNQRMRTATNYFIVNLAVGDILMALLCIPFTFPANLIYQYWPFGFSLCVIVSYSQANSVFISAYTMVAISIDKYLAIMYPMRLRMSKLQSKIIIIVIWSAALLTSLPTALLSHLAPGFPEFSSTVIPEAEATSARSHQQQAAQNSSLPPSNRVKLSMDPALGSASDSALKARNSSTQQEAMITTTAVPFVYPSASSYQQQQQQEQRKYFCQESWNFWPKGKYYYSMALMVLQFVVPLFVLVITYSQIVLAVWGKKMPGEEDNARDARMARSKRKMIKMVIFCVIAFALTWLPFNALIVIGDVHPDIWEHQNIMYIWFITHYLAMCHTITNPLIYIWMNNRFRAGFKQTIGDLFRTLKFMSIYLIFKVFCLGFCLNCSNRRYLIIKENIRLKQSIKKERNNNNPANNLNHNQHRKGLANHQGQLTGAGQSKNSQQQQQENQNQTSSCNYAYQNTQIASTANFFDSSSGPTNQQQQQPIIRRENVHSIQAREPDNEPKQKQANHEGTRILNLNQSALASTTTTAAAVAAGAANLSGGSGAETSRLINATNQKRAQAQSNGIGAKVGADPSCGQSVVGKKQVWIFKGRSHREKAAELVGLGSKSAAAPNAGAAPNEAGKDPGFSSNVGRNIDTPEARPKGKNDNGASEKGKGARRKKKLKQSHNISIQMTTKEYHLNNIILRQGPLELGKAIQSQHCHAANDCLLLSSNGPSAAAATSKNNQNNNNGSKRSKISLFTRKRKLSNERGKICLACKLQNLNEHCNGLFRNVSSVSGAANGRAPNRKSKDMFIMDMVTTRQSSQSTATISIQTNTSSLPISPQKSISNAAPIACNTQPASTGPKQGQQQQQAKTAPQSRSGSRNLGQLSRDKSSELEAGEVCSSSSCELGEQVGSAAARAATSGGESVEGWEFRETMNDDADGEEAKPLMEPLDESSLADERRLRVAGDGPRLVRRPLYCRKHLLDQQISHSLAALIINRSLDEQSNTNSNSPGRKLAMSVVSDNDVIYDIIADDHHRHHLQFANSMSGKFTGSLDLLSDQFVGDEEEEDDDEEAEIENGLLCRRDPDDFEARASNVIEMTNLKSTQTSDELFYIGLRKQEPFCSSASGSGGGASSGSSDEAAEHGDEIGASRGLLDERLILRKSPTVQYLINERKAIGSLLANQSEPRTEPNLK